MAGRTLSDKGMSASECKSRCCVIKTRWFPGSGVVTGFAKLGYTSCCMIGIQRGIEIAGMAGAAIR
jgi:hypothetical protein